MPGERAVEEPPRRPDLRLRDHLPQPLMLVDSRDHTLVLVPAVHGRKCTVERTAPAVLVSMTVIMGGTDENNCLPHIGTVF